MNAPTALMTNRAVSPPPSASRSAQQCRSPSHFSAATAVPNRRCGYSPNRRATAT